MPHISQAEEAEEASNLEMPMDADRKKKKNACLVMVKGSGKGRLVRQNVLFYTIMSLFQANTMEKQ